MAKIWCYVLDAEGVTGLTSFDGSVVGTPLFKHLYECEDDNGDLGGKLYHAANDKIDASDLFLALQAYYAPTITILGDNPAQVVVDTVYNDAGATAGDADGNHLTGDIVTVNNVDITTVGAYDVTYDVVDANGYEAPTALRVVNVAAVATTKKKPKKAKSVDKKSKG